MVALRKEEMLDLAEKAVDFALKKGADEAEAFVYQGLTTNVVIERGQIARSARIIDRGLGIRTIINKAIGFSYTNIMGSKAAIEETALKALSAAKASKPDKEWYGLPTKKQLKSVENTYDRKIVELHSEDLVNAASLMLDAAEKVDKRIFPVEGGVGASYLSRAIANSNGVATFDHGTIIECSLATVGQEAGEVTPICFEFNIERKYAIDPEWVGKEAARLAVSALKAKKIETKNTNVIFSQFALQELLYFTLINAVKADYVQRGQSAFKDKIGENVASEKVTIYDDGLLDGGIRTVEFDGEGVPQQKTLIIERGVLRNFLYDNYTAKKEGKESTGNATRAGYLSTPNVEATNFRFMLGKKSPEELIGEVNDGLLVYALQGAHSSNPASGEFSVVATPAWKVENGKIAYAVKGAMLAGNIFQLLKNILELANNERKIGQLVAPWVLAENVRVIGK
ncbi:MAG: TldD/PmbA family protein [Candidatus Bathyarchaeota archaeon]|nr:TldD/PmbA family protein [Candidatus Bathyarchaeota archaeon]